MARPLLALNWKLNKGPAEAGRWAHHLIGRLPDDLPADLALLAPFVSLQAVADALNLSKVAWGSQDVSEHTAGAYTGEVSAAMLAEICCKYAVVGHSERRQYHGESDETAGRKVRAAQAAGITPILCVGEALDVRESGNAVPHTLHLLEVALAETNVAKPEDLVIAYEPIWAIGTGRTATPDDAEQMGTAMRGFLNGRYGTEIAAGIRLLYGGSVKPDNIAALCSRQDVDGALVGGASLDLDSVVAMLNTLA
jgi:triosephosphate isomerase